MGQATYPSGTDAALYLTAAGLTVSADMQTVLNTAVTVGRELFERKTGRQFLGDAAATTRYYDPPVNNLSRLRIDDCWALSSVAYQPYNSAVTAFTLDLDYYSRPDNAAARGYPLEGLWFRRRWDGPISSVLRKSLQVTGKWGFAQTIPLSAWAAMISGGLLSVWPQIMLASTGGLISWTEADVTERSDPKLWSDTKDAWSCQYAAAVNLYRRVEI